MGKKKSRKGKPKAGRKGGGAPAAAGNPQAAALDTPPERAENKMPPPGAACWICLDGDPDDGGKPIVRDCSCRGDDAGFAHISCLVKYAEGKTRVMLDAPQPGQNPNYPWNICPHCLRDYQGEVGLDMAKSYLSFIDESYPPGMELLKLGALSAIVARVVHVENVDLRAEGKRAATEMLAILQRSGHLKDEDYINDQRAYAYAVLGRIGEGEETQDGYQMAVEYYGKARDSYESKGDHVSARSLEVCMNRVRSKRDGRKEGPPSDQQLQDLRAAYRRSVIEKGEEATDTLRSGLILIGALIRSRNSLECERLSTKLHAISRRVHGPDHDLTGRIENCLESSRVRILVKATVDGRMLYQVLRVNEERQKYIVKSLRPRGQTFVVGDVLEIIAGHHKGAVSEIAFDDDHTAILLGTPVVCHGLKNAQHLNGKLGDVRSFDKATGRYVVRFEDKALNKASVRPANLRVVIDLPDES